MTAPMTAKSDFRLAPPRSECVACGGSRLEAGPESVADDHSLAGFGTARCRDCGTLFVNPRPADSDLQAFYQQIGADEQTRFIEASLRYYRDPTRAGAMRQSYLEPLSRRRPTGKLLDFGCGAGWFVKLAGDAGYDSHGIDHMAQAVEAGRRELGLTTVAVGDEDTLAERADYDIIVCNNLIEHVVDPARFVARCMQGLRPGGLLMLSFPCADSAMFKALVQHSYFFMAPYHLTHFTRAGMTGMLNAAGFEDAQFESIEESFRWGHGVATSLGLGANYKGWREDREFIRFDIAVDAVLSKLAYEQDASLTQLVFAVKPQAAA